MNSMKIDWKIIDNCNFGCDYCTFYNNSSKDEFKSIQEYYNIIDSIIDIYKNPWFYIFGGEPFLHPNIIQIIEYLNYLNIQFIVHTNLSKKSFNIIQYLEKQKIKLKIIITAHPNQLNLLSFLDRLKEIKKLKYINIKSCLIMYQGNESFKLYKQVKDIIGPNLPSLSPLFNFSNLENEKLDYTTSLLEEYISYSNSKIHNKLYNFDKINLIFNGVKQTNNELLLKFQKKEEFLKGTICPFKSNYLLIDKDLNKYNCPYKTENNGICNYNTCVLFTNSNLFIKEIK